MARPRTPTNVLQLRGAYKRNPQRKPERENEPVPNAGIGPAPGFLTEDAKSAWDYLVGIVPSGVLGDCDRAYLEIASELLALKRRVGVEEMEAPKLARLEAMLGKLGLNPSDRSKVKALGAEKPRGRFAEL